MAPRSPLGGARRAIRHPSWALADWHRRRALRARSRELDGRGRGFSLVDHMEAVRDEPAAVMSATGADEERYRAALDGLWMPEPLAGDETAWSSREVLLRILGAVVRLLAAEVVVEVGVELGYSSALILDELEARRSGRLLSIDLPAAVGSVETGAAVPKPLRGRWQLLVGPSERRLGEALAATGEIDLFLHDGDHSYRSQRVDLARVWPRLRAGAVAIVDDVWTPAVVDFAAEVGAEPLLVRRWDDRDAIGLLAKPDG